ncbi:MAG: type II secretion system F family protein [Microbacteriaceae bacterium]|nr:type II secretion system F family protein [Microbacteriaceae bacterium]
MSVDNAIDLPKAKMRLYNGRKAKPELLARALRALAMVLRVGQSEARALEIVGQQFAKYDVGRAFTRAALSMRDHGATFKQAMLAEDEFPRTVRELIQASPTPQAIHANLVRAARLVAQGQDIKKKLLISLIQPASMIVMCLVFLFVASAYIVPSLIGTFATLQTKTPDAALIVMAAAEYVKWGIGALVVILLGGGLFWVTVGKRSAKVQSFFDTCAIRTPVVGSIVQLAATSRLFEMLAANLAMGRAEPASLESASAGSGNEAINQHCIRHAVKMRDAGAPLKDFALSRLFPSNASYLLASAPSIRQEIEILNELAPEYRNEADRSLDAFAKTVEPFVTGIVYGVAGLLICAVVIPMYAMFPALMQIAD